MDNWEDLLKNIPPFQVLQARAFLHNMRAIDLHQHPPTKEALHLVPASLAHRHGIVPVQLQHGRSGPVLVLAISDPENTAALDEVRQATGVLAIPVLASEEQIRAATERHYRSD